MAAARAGKHVLCEKPLAMTAADAEAMIEVCEAEGVRLMEAFMYRLHPSWVAVRELVAAGRIGRLTSRPELVQLLQRRPRQHPQHPRRRRRRALRHRLLQRQPLAACSSAPSRTASRRRSSATAVDGVDVLTSALLTFGEGMATFTCSIRAEPDQRVHIYGTEGRISIGIPFNIPPDRPTEVYLTAGGDPPVAPATEDADLRRRPTPTRSRPTPSPRPSSTTCRRPCRRRTRSPTSGSSSASSRPRSTIRRPDPHAW